MTIYQKASYPNCFFYLLIFFLFGVLNFNASFLYSTRMTDDFVYVYI